VSRPNRPVAIPFSKHARVLPASAQAPGEITLRAVTDSTEASNVTITSKTADDTQTVSANGYRFFSAPALHPGESRTRVEMQGFRSLVPGVKMVVGGSTAFKPFGPTGGNMTRLTVNLDHCWDSKALTFARQNLSVAAVDGLGSGRTTSLNSLVQTARRTMPGIRGVSGSGNTSNPINEAVSAIRCNCFNDGFGKSQISSRGRGFQFPMGGKTALGVYRDSTNDVIEGAESVTTGSREMVETTYLRRR
jgi:hypothetical protein